MTVKKQKPKTLREYKWQEEFKLQRSEWKKQYRAEKKAEYISASTIEQRRAFIELMRGGNISVACAAEKVGISTSHAVDVYYKNHKKVFYHTLVEPEKVK